MTSTLVRARQIVGAPSIGATCLWGRSRKFPGTFNRFRFFYSALRGPGVVRDGRVVGEHVQPTMDAGHVLVEDEQLRAIQAAGPQGRHAAAAAAAAVVVVGRLRATAAGFGGQLPGRIAGAAGGRAPGARRTGIAQGVAGSAELGRCRGPVRRRSGQTTLSAVRVVVVATTTSTAAAAVTTTTAARGQRGRTRGRGPAGAAGRRKGGIVVPGGRRGRPDGTHGAGGQEQPGQNAMAQGVQQDRPSTKREYHVAYSFPCVFRFGLCRVRLVKQNTRPGLPGAYETRVCVTSAFPKNGVPRSFRERRTIGFR